MPNPRALLTTLAALLDALPHPEQVQQVVTLLTALMRAVATAVPAVHPTLPYETRALALRLEISDAQGDHAVLRRDQQIRVRTGDGLVLREVIWGEGRQLARYRVQGARRLGVRREGAQQALLLDPDQPASAGRTVTVRSRRTIRGGFRQQEEYCATLLERPTDQLAITVVFPAERPPRNAQLVGGLPQRVLRRVAVRYQADGRARLACRLHRPAVAIPYRLEWTW